MSGTSKLKVCPKCGTPIPGEAPQGLCPRCLLAQASIATEAGAGRKEPPPDRQELAVAFPNLEILDLIGQGGMGFVFKARQAKLDRFVALKILPQSLAADPAFAERFTREGRVLARFNHPNIVTIHDFGQANGFFYLLMEFVDGVNLRQAMQVGRFTPDQALAIVPKICEALQFAHIEGILHRDIKPENILLDSRGRVKIADFGIAKLVGLSTGSSPSGGVEHSSDEPGRLTETGKVFGTPHYMAPEQIEHPQDVDQRADIYSLGVVFYEMLTGELPLGRFAVPSEKSAADPRLDDVVLRALEKERERRTRSANEVKTQVETIAHTPRSGGSVHATPAAPRSDHFWRRLAITAGCVLLALIVIPIPLIFLAYSSARSRAAQAQAQDMARRVRQQVVNAQNATQRTSEAARIKLEFAERRLKDEEQKYNAGLIPVSDFELTKLDRDLAQAELTGNVVEAARLKLEHAEKKLKRAEDLRAAGFISSSDYESARLSRDLAAADYRHVARQVAPIEARIAAPLEGPTDLREAKAKLAELRLEYGENHPYVRAQLNRIKELERMTREEPNASADLREAKARLAELRVNYSDEHPLIKAQQQRIKALEEN